MSEVNTSTSIDDGIPEVSFTLQVSNTQQAPVDTTLSISGMAADAAATGAAIQDARDDLGAAITALGGDIAGVYGNLYPVGSIYVSTSATAPIFGGESWTWQQIKMPATWGDLEDGLRSYAAVAAGDTVGTVHFWLRTA